MMNSDDRHMRVFPHATRVLRRAHARWKRLDQYLPGAPLAKMIALWKVANKAMVALPEQHKPTRLLPHTKIVSTAVVDQVFAELREESGTAFCGYRSDPGHVLQYLLLADHLPDAVTADTYRLAVEVEERWTKIRPSRFFPPPGGIAIEGGCYTGLKALKWADLLGPNGRIAAVEIDATNFELLCRNIGSNNLQTIITPVRCGLWNEDGSETVLHSTGRRQFLTTTDEWERKAEDHAQVPTLTLDSIMNQHQLPYVDYINIQVNGAELEVLKGLRDRREDVKVLGIAAYYSINGMKNADRVEAWAREVGWNVAAVSKKGRVTLVNPIHADEVARWPRLRKTHQKALQKQGEFTSPVVVSC